MNEFDQLSGYYNDEEDGSLGGFSFKKFRRKIKKIHKKPFKLIKKVHKKTFKIARRGVKNIGRGIEKAANNKAVQVAALAAGAYFAAPLVAGTAKKFAFKKVSAKLLKRGISRARPSTWKRVDPSTLTKPKKKKSFFGGAKNFFSNAKKAADYVGARAGVGSTNQIARNFVNNKLRASGLVNTVKQNPETIRQLKSDVSNVSTIANSPEFQALFAQLSAQGKSLNEIQNKWAQSQTFKDIATPQVAATVQPMLQQDYMRAGMSGRAAYEKSIVEADSIAQKEVNKMGKMPLIIGASVAGIGLLALVLKGKK